MALAGAVPALLFPVLAHAQSTVRWTTNYYSITGATHAEIRKALSESRPWKDKSVMDGWTAWRISCRFNVTPTMIGCRCDSFTTRTTITITLPRWMPPANTSESVKQRWTGYFATLARHEAGHGQFALAAVAELRRRIGEIGEDTNCDGLKKQINDLIQRTIEDYRKRDQEYDERTGHGMRQGAPPTGTVRGRSGKAQ